MTAYTIIFDPNTAFLEVRVQGFWDQDMITSFAEEFAAKLAELRAAGAAFGVLADASEFSVQGQQISEGLTRIVDADNHDNRAPSALVIGSALVKMQAARTMAADHVRIFASREEAMVWLDDKLGRTAA